MDYWYCRELKCFEFCLLNAETEKGVQMHVMFEWLFFSIISKRNEGSREDTRAPAPQKRLGLGSSYPWPEAGVALESKVHCFGNLYQSLT